MCCAKISKLFGVKSFLLDKYWQLYASFIDVCFFICLMTYIVLVVLLENSKVPNLKAWSATLLMEGKHGDQQHKHAKSRDQLHHHMTKCG